jgi:hypothetical protein
MTQASCRSWATDSIRVSPTTTGRMILAWLSTQVQATSGTGANTADTTVHPKYPSRAAMIAVARPSRQSPNPRIAHPMIRLMAMIRL